MRKSMYKATLFFLTMCVFTISFGQAPTISSFTPNSGTIGTLITINGTNLSNPTNFTIGGVSAIVVSNNGSQLVGMVMPGATTGLINVTTGSGNTNSVGNFSVSASQVPNVQQGNKLVGTGAINVAQQGTSVAISADGKTAIVGGQLENSGEGAVWFYTKNGNSWIQQGFKIVGIGTSTIPASGFGHSVAINADGTTAIVGGDNDNNIGAVWVFTRSGNIWTQQGNKLVGTGWVNTLNPRQGTSVALSADGNTALVGGIGDNNITGAVWVFTRSGNIWTQQGNKLVGTDATSGFVYQGISVSLSADGNTAIVGGQSDNNGVGAAWVFTRSGNIWLQQGNKLVGTGAVGNAYQGSNVSLSADGNTALVGGPGDNSLIGATWVFSRVNGIWSQQGNKLLGSDASMGSVFQGIALSLSADGNIALVGGEADNNFIGATWIYTRRNGVWMQQGNKIIGTGTIGNANQGNSVSISADGKTAIVGGNNDNSAAGAAWIFAPLQIQAPAITNFSASSGPVGSLVTITGTNLSNPTNITIGGVSAIPISNNGTSLVAMVMPGATTGVISVTTAGGTISSLNNFNVTVSQTPNTQQGNKIIGTGSIGNANQGISVSVSADGNTAVVGGINDNSGVGAVWFYTRTGNSWTQQGDKIVGTGSVGIPLQGWSVSVSADGNTAIVGGKGDNNDFGAAWIFTRSSGVWSQQGNKLVGTGSIGNANQGTSVTLSADGNTAIIGGNNDNSGIGAIWIFTRNGNTWSQQGNKLIGTGADGTAMQGSSVSLSADGNTAIVGGPTDSYLTTGSGAVWIFTKNGNIWTQQGNKLVGSGFSNLPMFGQSVSISADGNTAIVGGFMDNAGIGAAWIFIRNGNVWTQQGNKLVGSGSIDAPRQGQTVSISADGNKAIIGGYGNNNYEGAAWIFIRSSGVWNQQGNKLIGSGASGQANQGLSVAISADGTTAVVCGPGDNNSIGATWIFTPQTVQPPTITTFSPSNGPVGSLVTITGTNLSTPTNISIGGVSAIQISNDGTSLVAMVMPGATTGVVSITTTGGTISSASNFTVTPSNYPNHQQGNKLVGSGAIGSAYQGYSVAISADGNTAIVGGNHDNNDVGAAWIYTRSGGVWSQQGNKLVGSGAIGNAQQGFSVAISADGNTAVVGGLFDNNAAGAIWMFTRSAGIWSQQGNKLVGSGEIGNSRQGISVSISADGNTAVAGGSFDNNGIGAVWVYTRNAGIWAQDGNKLIGSGSVGTPYQGTSLSLSGDGNTIIVGGYSDNNATGAAWVFNRNNGIWSQQGNKLIGTGAIGISIQGISVSISADGNTAVVGGYGDNNNLGAAWVYIRTGNVWTQQGNKLVASDGVLDAYLGYSVCISADGNTALIGGNNDNTNVGAAWVFARNNGVWVQKGKKLVGTGSINTAQQGFSVSISADGSTGIVGGFQDNSVTGAVWMYDFLPIQPPTITNFSATNGPVGSLVTITGTNLSNPTNITISGVSAIPISNNGTTIIAMVMPGATTGVISITTAGGSVSSANNFTVTTSAYPNHQQGNKLVGANNIGSSKQGSALALSADGNTAIIGGLEDNNNQGAAWIFTRNNSGVWSQQGTKLVGTGGSIDAKQGISVSISADGNTAAVGGLNDNNNLGAVWIFTRDNGGTWTQQGNKLFDNTATNAHQGNAISLSADGNTILVGGYNDNSGVGAAWIYTRTGLSWNSLGTKLVGTNNLNAQLGWSVSLSADGNAAIIGGYSDFAGNGAVWMFRKNGSGTWLQEGDKLVGSGNIGHAQQGASVSINADGTTAIIGGYADNSMVGAAWVFTRNNSGVWSQQGNKLVGSGLTAQTYFGNSVSISADGNSIAIGGWVDNNFNGASWIFGRSNNTWSQQGNKLVANDNAGFAVQGVSVALSADGTTLLSGGKGDNSGIGATWSFINVPMSAPSIGSFSPASGTVGSLITINGANLNNLNSFTIGAVPAIIISNNGTQIVAMVMPGATTGNISITTAGGTATSATNFTVEAAGIPNTQQGNKLVGTGNIGNSYFGYSVALSADGNTAAVSGINDNGDAGAVWVYVRSGSTWTQQGNKLVGSNAIGNATQGNSIAISVDGNTILVGGYNDNTMVGAAWVFTRTGNVWSQQGNKLVPSGNIGNSALGYSVALSADGNTALIGGIYDNGAVGAAWVFIRNGNTWTQQGPKLVGSGSDFNSQIGRAVSLSADGNTAMIGGYNDNDRTGACWVFIRSGNVWSQQGSKLVPNDFTGKPYFGGSVSLSADGNTAVIGGFGENNNEGAIWVFIRSANTWTQQTNKLVGSGSVGSANHGFIVSISADGSRIIEGAPADDNFNGGAWLFTKTGNASAQEGNKIVGNGSVSGAHGALQGVSVAISADGNTVSMGGSWDDNNNGAAWIFVPGSSAGSGGGAVSGGGSGGLESKSLGDAVVKRVYAKAQANLNGPDDYNKMQLIVRSNNTKQIAGIGSGASIKLAGIMPDISSKGFTAYNSTPTDITAITNAKEVLSTDFTADKQCKAVAFATKTQGELYDHTKPICDRLKGASLVSVENMNLGGYDFVKYTLNNEKGQLEYATSFSVGMKSGRNDFSIQSTWLLKDYISDETMFNFQLWAATPELVKAMVNDVLTKLQSIAPIKSIAKASIPATYILAGKREAQNLNLIVTNASANTSGYFTLEDKANETNLGTVTRKIPFTINSNGVTNVSIPMSDLYESTITMYVNGEMKDVVYMSDGTWYADYNKSTTTVNSFTISNDANRTITADEFPLMRNVALNANSKDYVSIVKLLKGGGVETDLTPYKGLKITASGGYNLHITLVKNSTANWNDQYFTDIKLDQGQKDYFVPLDKFVSNASKDKILANDITTVVFSIEVGSNGNSSPINTTLSNVSFTKEDLAITNSLESKEVQVYPNPANAGKFICSFLSDKATELTLKVNDITGRQLLSKQITANKGQNSVPVTISNFTNGFHILSLEGTGIKYQAKKVMITN